MVDSPRFHVYILYYLRKLTRQPRGERIGSILSSWISFLFPFFFVCGFRGTYTVGSLCIVGATLVANSHILLLLLLWVIVVSNNNKKNLILYFCHKIGWIIILFLSYTPFSLPAALAIFIYVNHGKAASASTGYILYFKHGVTWGVSIEYTSLFSKPTTPDQNIS